MLHQQCVFCPTAELEAIVFIQLGMFIKMSAIHDYNDVYRSLFVDVQINSE